MLDNNLFDIEFYLYCISGHCCRLASILKVFLDMYYIDTVYMSLGCVDYSYDLILPIQLRESIAQDQERTESSKVQMLELETSIQTVDGEVHSKEMMLKDLRKLQDQVSRKTAERSTLFKEQQRQYAALSEENEGFLFYYHNVNAFVVF